MSKDDLSTFGEYEKELRKAEKKVAGEIDPGARAVVVAVCILALMGSLVLAHAGTATGLDVLTNSSKSVAEHIKLPSKIFVYMLVVFGIGFSGLALVTRRWVIAWIALAGCAVTSVAGMLAIWTRNTVGVSDLTKPSSASVGLILGWIVMIVLTFHWCRAVWSRSTYHLQLEQQRREEAAAREAFGMSLHRPEAPAPAQSDDDATGDDDGDSTK